MSEREHALHGSIEEAWIHVSGETMPTAAEIAANPMAALRAFFYSGAVAAMDIVYFDGFAAIRDELHEWTTPPSER